MNTSEFAIILIAICLVIYFSARFALKIKARRGVNWVDLKEWLKNIIDSIFGVG